VRGQGPEQRGPDRLRQGPTGSGANPISGKASSIGTIKVLTGATRTHSRQGELFLIWRISLPPTGPEFVPWKACLFWNRGIGLKGGLVFCGGWKKKKRPLRLVFLRLETWGSEAHGYGGQKTFSLQVFPVPAILSEGLANLFVGKEGKNGTARVRGRRDVAFRRR